ncbi:MAG TPA: DUF1778 domain-containing protein [Terriglobales bacterium]|nr:DUF1778 domain-containing protein [Terriglobales bacterium]
MPASKGAQRSQTINLRISRAQKFLIDQAAQALGRNRSDFMLAVAAREAETVLLERRYFSLAPQEFSRFVAMLDRDPAPNPRLRRLLKSTPPWKK